MALGGYLKIPISSSDSARARGRTSGEYEFGPILMFGQESGGKRFRLYENIGYIRTTDPSIDDVKLLDIPDKLLLNAGMSIAVKAAANASLLVMKDLRKEGFEDLRDVMDNP